MQAGDLFDEGRQGGARLRPGQGRLRWDPRRRHCRRGGAGGHQVVGGLPGRRSAARALAAGAAKGEIAGVLLAIAPVAGMGRVVSAAPGHPGHQRSRQAAADRAMATEPISNHPSSDRRERG